MYFHGGSPAYFAREFVVVFLEGLCMHPPASFQVSLSCVASVAFGTLGACCFLALRLEQYALPLRRIADTMLPRKSGWCGGRSGLRLMGILGSTLSFPEVGNDPLGETKVAEAEEDDEDARHLL